MMFEPMRLPACTALLAVVALASPAAYAQATYKFDLPPQSLAESLRAVALQTSTNVLFESEMVRDLSAPALRAQLTVSEAIGRLLAGTNLRAESMSTDTVILQRATTDNARETASSGSANLAPPQSARDDETAKSFWSRFRLAQAETASREQVSDGSRERLQERIELEEIVVTGSRLKMNSKEESPASVIVFDREKIDRSGASSIREVLLYIPQASSVRDDSASGLRAAGINLRGIGFGTTLVLINGRRAGSSGIGMTGEYFDLNSIPLAMVERVEVLTEGASAVYGTDAIAGIINIILRKDFAGLTFGARYSNTADGKSPELQGSLGYGWNGERLRGSLLLSASDRDPLYTDDRDRTRTLDHRAFGGGDWRTTASNPGNVYSLNGQPLPGLTSTSAGVPAGSSGVGLTPASFAASDGVLNRTTARSSLAQEARRIGGLGIFEFSLGEKMALFSELAYTDQEAMQERGQAELTGGQSGNFRVPASNPFNPFGVPVGIDYSFDGLPPWGEAMRSEYARGLLGARGAAGSRFEWELAGLLARDEAESPVLNRVNADRVRAALNQTDPALALNVFRDGPGGSPELLRSLVQENWVSRFTTDLRQADGFVRGAFGHLPGGAFEFVIGGEWRSERLERNDSLGATITPRHNGDRDVKAGYAELRLPVVGAQTQWKIHELTARLAARYDDYSDFGGTFNPQYSLEFSPIESLSIRGSLSHSFHAPALQRIVATEQVIPNVSLRDPRRNETVPVTLITGGTPNLYPEEGESLTVGLLLRPAAVPRLKIGIDYWRLEVTDALVQLSTPVLLANEALFPELFTRAAPTAEDVAAGRPGRLLSLKAPSVNFGGIETNGVDLRAEYTWVTSLGSFAPFANVTYVDSFKVALRPGLPPSEQVDLAAITPGTVVRWRGNAGLAFSRGAWSGAGTVRYVDDYRDATFPTFLPANREVSAHMVADVRAAYDFDSGVARDSGWLSGLRISAGMLNVLDEQPPFSLLTTQGYDASQGDIRGRTVYVELNKRF